MGQVYLAEDTKLHRKVSLKFLSSNFAQDQERMRRFEQEARAVSTPNHPNILTIYEIGGADGHRFIATEFIEGQTLRERLRAGIDVEDAIEIAIGVASALVAAHRVNIVHRDIKPENIMIRTEDGLVKVLDFGLAKIAARRASVVVADSKVATTTMANTAPGIVMGTVAYMSPEQARGDTIDERTDIWSLGVVLYEMLSGCSPFMAGTSNEIISAILSKEPPPPLTRFTRLVPERLEEIIEKALAKNRDERYQTSRDLLIDLKRLKQSLKLKANIDHSSSSGATISRQQPDGRNTASADGMTTHPTSSAEYIVNQVKSHKRAVLVTLAPLALVLTFGAIMYTRNSRQATGGAQPQIRSLAVLPLANLSGDQSQEYFSDGMTDELITEVAKLANLQVISRGSVMRFKNSTVPVPEIAHQLGVDAVLTGSVMRAGGRARITVQLIRADTDRHLWAESYERDLKDVLLLQRDIANDVGRQISQVTGQQSLTASSKPRQVDQAAHEAYLQGTYYSNKKTPESKRKALEYFKEATRISPFYPEAHANIADCYLSLGGWYAGLERNEALAKARAAIDEALRQDESLPVTHVVLGYLSQEYEWDWITAEREFRRAVELNPSYAAAHLALAFHLLLVGRLVEVPDEVERARRADPLSLTDVSVGAWILEYAGHHQEAVARGKAVVQMDPNIAFTQFNLGLVYMDVGELDKAAEQFRTAIQMYPAFGKFKAHLAFVLARSGDKQQARKLLDELLQSRNIVSFDVGLVMAGLGEQEQAIDWVEKAYRERSNEMIFLRVLATSSRYERPFYFLRSNPRFKDLLRKMNFSEAWN
jgi:eukaryotic-like serine/threonine-protein kinase